MLISCVHLLNIKVVHLHQVLLELRLAEEIVDAEVDPLFSVVLGRAHELDFVIDKVYLGLRFAEVACNGRLQTLRIHVSFEF